MHALGIAAALVVAAPAEPIEWAAPAECPSAAAARVQVRELLGGEPGPDARVHVRIAEREGTWVAEVDVQDTGVRTLQHRDCATLTEAAALVVAVSLDPVQVVENDRGEPREVPDTPDAFAADPATALPENRVAAPRPGADTSPQPRADALPRPSADARPSSSADALPQPATPLRLRHALRLGGGVAYAPVPAIAGAFVLGYAAAAHLWRVEAGLAYATPRTRVYADGEGGRFQTLALDVRGCVTPRAAAVQFPLCAGPSAGLVFARGVDLERARNPVRGFVTLGLGGGVRVDVHPRLAVWAAGEASFGLARPVFHIDERPVLFAAPSFGGRGLLGVEISWP